MSYKWSQSSCLFLSFPDSITDTIFYIRLILCSRSSCIPWEDTELLLLPKANRYYERVNNIPAFREMRIRLDDNNHIATQYRLHSSINHTAEYRYEDLMTRYPEFVQRFPQHIIASYIGITKETLSRIRNQSVKNKL